MSHSSIKQHPLIHIVLQRSPDCAALRRQPCSERAAVPNTCGACLPGTWGGDGPMNAVCLSRTACAAIYPGEEILVCSIS
eukprot:g4128.t1